MELQDLLFMIAAILIGAVIVYLFVWLIPILMPIVVLLLIAFLVYLFLKERYSDRF